MKLCTALGWKVCCVSLHYNLDAIEVTHRTHSRSKTEFRGDAGWGDSPIGDLLSSKPLVPSFPLQTLLDRHAELVMSQCDCHGLCYTRRRVRLPGPPAVWTERVLTTHVNAAAERWDVRERTITLKHWNDSSPCYSMISRRPPPKVWWHGPRAERHASISEAPVSQPPSRCLAPLPPPVSRSGARFVCSAYRH